VRPQELEHVFDAALSTGREAGQVTQDVGDPEHVPHEDEQGRHTPAPVTARVEFPVAVEENVPEGQLETQLLPLRNLPVSVQDVQIPEDVQVAHPAGHAVHVPLLPKLPDGQIERHRAELRKAPWEHAEQVALSKFAVFEKLGIDADEHSRGAASQRDFALL